jgi:hypothetical protein
MPKPLLVLLVILISGANIYAQKNNKQRDSSIIIFSESPRSTKSSKNYASGENNVIKIAPLGFLKGCIPVYYERRITDFLAIQGGVGLTTRNYIRAAIYNATSDDNTGSGFSYTWWNTTATGTVSDDDNELYNFDYRKPKLGYFASLQPRIYFESEAPDGSFLGLSFDHYKYNFESQQLVGDGTSTRGTKTVKEFEQMTDIMVLFGYQSVYDHITLEYTTGIGVRNIKGEKYATAMNSSGKYVDGIGSYKKTALNFELSLKVGFHF